jgi:hypothetical protein
LYTHIPAVFLIEVKPSIVHRSAPGNCGKSRKGQIQSAATKQFDQLSNCRCATQSEKATLPCHSFGIFAAYANLAALTDTNALTATRLIAEPATIAPHQQGWPEPCVEACVPDRLQDPSELLFKTSTRGATR